jgi:hypothetical protein
MWGLAALEADHTAAVLERAQVEDPSWPFLFDVIEKTAATPRLAEYSRFFDRAVIAEPKIAAALKVPTTSTPILRCQLSTGAARSATGWATGGVHGAGPAPQWVTCKRWAGTGTIDQRGPVRSRRSLPWLIADLGGGAIRHARGPSARIGPNRRRSSGIAGLSA